MSAKVWWSARAWKALKVKIRKQSQNWKQKETGAWLLGPNPTETKENA